MIKTKNAAVPNGIFAWDGMYTSSRGTIVWDGMTQNHHQTLAHLVVPVGRNVGTVLPTKVTVPSQQFT